MARGLRLCDKWYGEWSDDSTIDECLERYVKGFDFCVKNDWPPLDFIRRNFRREDLHRHHIYLDEEVRIDGGNGYYIFLGDCKGEINFFGLYAATVYVMHGSNILVRGGEGAKVFVSLYGGDVMCIDDGWAKVKLYYRNRK